MYELMDPKVPDLTPKVDMNKASLMFVLVCGGAGSRFAAPSPHYKYCTLTLPLTSVHVTTIQILVVLIILLFQIICQMLLLVVNHGYLHLFLPQKFSQLDIQHIESR